MKEKRLFSTTVAPSALYVPRQADYQVERIIQAMGRPGYVLVSRQMGKTNLLLNAIRMLQRPEDAFVYVDLSSTYSTLRECFRSMIDIALSIHEEKFQACADSLAKLRERVPLLPPHREHEAELRLLLQSINGKLVIFLDEIDALTRTNYSDELFSKIRSMYMIREVTPIFKRLTYILSGVAEPSELIKNKALSPFNIGEKIYLEPFTKEEYLMFLEKAELSFPSDVADYLYERTRGNPRMLWDICSDIEDQIILENISLTPSLIDHTISRLYLTTFDRPPIDHIRNILITDRNLRNALTVIRWNKGETISDETKRRLHLYGIIGSYSQGQPISIANSIVDASVSQSWVENIDAAQADDMESLNAAFSSSNYAEMVRIAQNQLANAAELEPGDAANFVDIMIHGYLGTRQYEAVLQAVDGYADQVNGVPIFVFQRMLFKAIALWHMNRRRDSMALFVETINSAPQPLSVLATAEFLFLCLPFENGHVSINEFTDTYFSRFLDMSAWFEDTLARVSSLYQIIDVLSTRNIRVKALQLLSIGYACTGKHNESLVFQKKMQALAEPEAHLFLRWQYCVTCLNPEEKKQTLASICNELADAGFHLAERTPPQPFRFDMEAFASLVVNAVNLGISSEIEELVLSIDLPARWGSHVHMLADIAFHIRELGQSTLADQLVVFSWTRWKMFCGSKDERTLLELHRLMLGNVVDFSNLAIAEIADRYFILFERCSSAALLSISDIELFIRFTLFLIESKRASRVHGYLAKITQYRKQVSLKLRPYFIVFDFIQMIAYGGDIDPKRRIDCAKRILTGLPVLPDAETMFRVFPIDISEIRSHAASVLSQEKNRPVLSFYRIPRNQIITVSYDGRIVRDKFKRLEADINSGRCVIISE